MKNSASDWINSPILRSVLEIKNNFVALFHSLEMAWRIQLKFQMSPSLRSVLEIKNAFNETFLDSIILFF